MNIDSTNVSTAVTTTLGTICTVISDNVIYQIIFGILTILGLIINIIYTIYKWYRVAKRDGVISKNEIDNLINDLSNSIKKGDDNGKH